jgi:uncharacterized protein
MSTSPVIGQARGTSKPLVGMIHLPPLPGAWNYTGMRVADMAARAAHEAELLCGAGFDHILIQNTHDRPSTIHVPAESLTAMTAIAVAVARAVPQPIGLNIHKNDGPGAIAVAHACEAAFVRIKVLVGAVLGPEGLIQGNAREVAALRGKLQSKVEVWADIGELTSTPVTNVSIRELADWAARFGCADRLIITRPTVELSVAAVLEARTSASIPILIGGRTDPQTIAEALERADGVIVGSWLRIGGKTSKDLDPDRINRFIAAVSARVESEAS